MAEGNTTTLQAPSCQSISKSLPKFGWQNVEFSNLAKDMTNEKIVHLQEFPIFHFPNHKFVNLVVFFLTWLLTSSPLTVFSAPPSLSRNTQTCVPTRASNDGAARRISGRAEGASRHGLLVGANRRGLPAEGRGDTIVIMPLGSPAKEAAGATPAARRLWVSPPPGEANKKGRRRPGEANKKGRSRFTWACLGLSCKGSTSVVEQEYGQGGQTARAGYA